MISKDIIQRLLRRRFILPLIALFLVNILLICYEPNTGSEQEILLQWLSMYKRNDNRNVFEYNRYKNCFEIPLFPQKLSFFWDPFWAVYLSLYLMFAIMSVKIHWTAKCQTTLAFKSDALNSIVQPNCINCVIINALNKLFADIILKFYY